MKYIIKVRYKTGHSLDSWEETDEIGWVWTDEKLAKEALRRLKEHYEWYRDYKSTFRDTPSKPDYVGPTGKLKHSGYVEEEYVQLPVAKDEVKSIYPVYMGHFERPIEAWIEIEDSTVRF